MCINFLSISERFINFFIYADAEQMRWESEVILHGDSDS